MIIDINYVSYCQRRQNQTAWRAPVCPRRLNQTVWSANLPEEAEPEYLPAPVWQRRLNQTACVCPSLSAEAESDCLTCPSMTEQAEPYYLACHSLTEYAELDCLACPSLTEGAEPDCLCVPQSEPDCLGCPSLNQTAWIETLTAWCVPVWDPLIVLFNRQLRFSLNIIKNCYCEIWIISLLIGFFTFYDICFKLIL